MKTKQLKTGEIIAYQNNNKTHSNAQIDYVAGLIEQYGFTQPLVVDSNNNLIIGHCRLDSAKRLNLKTVPCVIMDGLTETQVKALRIQDNRASEMGKWDTEALVLELQELQDLGFNIDDLSLDNDLIDSLEFEQKQREKEEKEDDIPDLPAEPKSKLGDIYQLGNHKIMCGDSTKEKDVALLMDGVIIDMVFTDPPYGIDYHANTEGSQTGLSFTKRTIHDKIIGDEDTSVATKAVRFVLENYPNSSIIFWGANYYCQSFPQGYGWLFWDKVVDMPTFSGGEFAFTNRGVKSSVFTHKWSGALRETEKGTERRHPNQKPIALAEYCFNDYGNPKNVLDLFLGSGSTLIACEKTNRKCYGMELDPKYIDVIIKRYEEYTGKEAVKL